MVWIAAGDRMVFELAEPCAKATCSARERSWSLRNRTLCFSSSDLISSQSLSSSIAAARLTLCSSAPMQPVRRSIWIEPGVFERIGSALWSAVAPIV
jgi:hypothetical protein